MDFRIMSNRNPPILTIILFISIGIPFNSGLKCHECGELSIISSENTCRNSVNSCTYHLSANNGFKRSPTMFSSILNSTTTRVNAPIREVCYRLSGKFRGENLRMRGCDALPIDNIEIETCRDSVSLWFETEAGREYITDNSLCICGTDFCNEYPPPTGSGISLISWTCFSSVQAAIVITSILWTGFLN